MSASVLAYASHELGLTPASQLTIAETLMNPPVVTPCIISTKDVRLTVPELTASTQDLLIANLMSGFRVNYLASADTLEALCISIIVERWSDDYVTSLDQDSRFFEQIKQKAFNLVKQRLRSYRNAMPLQYLMSLATDAKVRTVADLKSALTSDIITARLSTHIAFTGHSIEPHVMSMLLADVEQKMMNQKAHLALGEGVGSRPDSEGHFAGLKAWRKGGQFSVEAFTPHTIVPGDSDIELTQKYTPFVRVSPVKKRKQPRDALVTTLDCEPTKKPRLVQIID